MEQRILDHQEPRKKKKAEGRQALVVLGMHRSGTSAITRVLSLLGADLPRNVLGVGEGNDSGHWEPVKLYQLHDVMLSEAGSRWNDWRAFDPNVLGAERSDFYQREIRRVLEDEYGGSPFLVLKEPRICRFVPLLDDVLQQLHIKPVYIHIHRNPLDVVSSLHKRDGLSNGFSGLLWLRHVLDAEVSTRGKRRVFISYEDVLRDWRGVIDRISATLSLDWPRQTSDAATDISNHLSIDLQHHRHNQADIQIDPSMSDWIRETYEALRTLERDGDPSPTLDVLDNVRQQFNKASANIGDPMFAELIRHEVSFLAQNRAVADVADERLSEIGRLVAHQRGLVEKIDALGSDLSARSHELLILNNANDELTKRQAELDFTVLSLNGDLANTMVRAANAESDLQISKTALQEFEGLHQSLQNERLALEGHHQNLQSEYQIFRDEHRVLEDQYERLQNERQTLQDQHQKLQSEWLIVRDEHQVLRDQHRELQHEQQTLESQHQALQDERQTLQDQHQNLQSEQQTLKGLHQTLQNERQMLEGQIQLLRNEHRTLEQHHQIALQQSSELQKLGDIQKKRIADFEINVSTLRKNRRASDTLVKKQTLTIATFQQKVIEDEVEREGLDRDRRKTAALLGAAEENLHTLRHEIDGYKQAIQTLNATLCAAETETARLSADATNAEKEAARLLFKQATASSRQRVLSKAGSSLWQPMRLYPLNHLARIDNEATATTWHAETDDPQFELFWSNDRSLPPGHYVLKLKGVTTPDEFHQPRLYFDTGSGFNETESAALDLDLRNDGTVITTFSLFLPAQRIRFDPRTEAGSFSLGQILIRKTSRLTYYGGITRRLARQHRASGQSLSVPLRHMMTELNRNGLKGVAARLRESEKRSSDKGDYQAWIDQFDSLTADVQLKIRKAVERLDHPPLISVLMPVYNTPEVLLREAIHSVIGQIYENWELCIADDCSTKSHVRKILKEYAARDARIKITFRPKNGHISHASNSALQLVTGEWLALLDHDDILRPHALAEVALEIARHPSAQLIYSDEDKIDSNGKRYDPYFKPDFSREMFRSQNYFNHLTVHRTQNIRTVGGWRPGYEGSQDYDLNLRIVERVEHHSIRHIPKILYHWRAVEGSTAVSGSEKNYAFTAGLNALQDHVERMKLPAVAEEAPGTPFYRLRFFIPEPQPLVSLIIPTRDRVELLKGCIGSILRKTTYPRYEIIVVDNGSSEPQTLDYFREIAQQPNIRVLPYEKPFNYSAINNFAVEQAKGSIVGLINNDIEVISPDWLTEMVSWAIQPDIGCVGAKLYYANHTIQHAGVVLGVGGVAGHSHKYFDRDALGYFGRLRLVQNVSAVTAACLVVRKELYRQVGGLNERDLTVAFNDVDFCLKIRDAGKANVWTPYAQLYHLESISRGSEDTPEKAERFRQEVLHMLKTWELDHDPYYSIHLTRVREDFSIGMNNTVNAEKTDPWSLSA